MSEAHTGKRPPESLNRDLELRKLRRRYRKDWRFKMYTIAALVISGAILIVLLVDLLIRGIPALTQAEILTEITFSPETMQDAKLPFPEEIRDLVSRTSELEVWREAQRAEISVLVHYSQQSSSSPEDSVQAATLTLNDYGDDVPEFLRDEQPYQVPREHLLTLLGKQGLQNIRDNIREDPALAGTEQRDWLRGSESLEQFMRDSSGLDAETKQTAEQLYARGMLRLSFNQVKFGEGTTVEKWVLANSDVDQYLKGYAAMQPTAEGETEGRISREQADRIDRLRDAGKIKLRFNSFFFFDGDSKQPESAGIYAAAIGSVYVLALVFAICVPIGVMTSIYLEEYAPDNWLTQTIEVNINNLAAVPSILFGVLGLAMMINFLGIPRASVLIGAAVLVLRTLPIIIISSRAALRAVPDSIRMAGFAMGATRWQVILHHVLPASLSGIMTGSIIGIAQAMGETAPLLIVGLVAFVSEAPAEPHDVATVLPALIFSWFRESRIAFQERSALAILVLLIVLCALNALALYIRTRAEKKW